LQELTTFCAYDQIFFANLDFTRKDEYSGGRGGKIGGKVVASKAASAAGIPKVVPGINFPKKKRSSRLR
jgi:hypothetical protein